MPNPSKRATDTAAVTTLVHRNNLGHKHRKGAAKKTPRPEAKTKTIKTKKSGRPT
jgi:hypothetical protein